jgi:phage terminase small subunit
MALTDKQKLFAAEYTVDLNATQAAIRAGYSAKAAAQIAYKLLQLTEVKEIIAASTKTRFERININADFVLQGLARIAKANATDLLRIDPSSGRAMIDLRNATPDVLETISSIEEEEFVDRVGSGRDAFEAVRKIRFKLHDKGQAYIALGRHLKLFTDRVEVEDVADPKEKLKDFLKKRRAAKE